MNSRIEIPVEINISDKDIERLEKAKQLLQDIKDINSNFKLSNVIETNKDTILLFNLKCLYTDKEIKDLEIFLTDKLNHKCIVLQEGLSLDKVIGIDYAEGKDYTTVTYYNENGKPIKEETIQHK